jgi:outer membrane protein OmpA-like peptidoglycan-associated protein
MTLAAGTGSLAQAQSYTYAGTSNNADPYAYLADMAGGSSSGVVVNQAALEGLRMPNGHYPRSYGPSMILGAAPLVDANPVDPTGMPVSRSYLPGGGMPGAPLAALPPTAPPARVAAPAPSPAPRQVATAAPDRITVPDRVPEPAPPPRQTAKPAPVVPPPPSPVDTPKPAAAPKTPAKPVQTAEAAPKSTQAATPAPKPTQKAAPAPVRLSAGEGPIRLSAGEGPIRAPEDVIAQTITPKAAPAPAPAPTVAPKPAQVAAAPAPAPKTPPAPKPEPVAPAKAAPPPPPPVVAAPAPTPAPQPQVAARATPSPGEDGGVTLAFAPGSPDPGKDANAQLTDIVQALTKDPSRRVRVLSYASDTAGNANQAKRLSLTRALNVRAYLMDQGVRSPNIEVRAMGNQDAGSNPDRVEVHLSP